MMLRSLDWLSVVVPSIKREIEFRGRSRWDKVGCIKDRSLVQVEVPVEYPVRCKNLKLVGINIEVHRVND